MSEQLSGRELDKAIALALGYFVEKSINGREWILIDPELQHTGDENWVNSEAQAWSHVPAFHADANAVIDVCAAHGLSHSVEYDKHGVMFAAVWSKDERIIEHANVIDGKFQEALARALLAALTAEAGT